MPTKKQQTLKVDGTEVPVSNLDKVYYPEAGFTKGEMLAYYIGIAPVLLPHLEGRPLTMKRYPNGVAAPFFYEKQCPKPKPPFVETCTVERHHKPGEIQFCMVNNLATLVWAANLGDLELHTFLSRSPDIDQPTQIVFDLDPGPPANAVQCAQVAIWIKEMFDNLGLQVFAKSSGSKGIQIYIPLNTPTTYEETSPFAKAVAQTLEKAHPELVVSNMKKELRHGKVLVDWSQNSETKTTVCVYSLRAKDKPFVSMPLEWKEIEQCLKKKDASLLYFEAEKALKRVKKKGDLFEPVLNLKQDLQKALRNFGSNASTSTTESGSDKPATTAKKPRLKGTGDGTLAAYQQKRDFTQTAEPTPSKPRKKTTTKTKSDTPEDGKLLFVIQKHDATSLHYDFRLELDGVLKSWAVPKGPPTDLETKRLALMVEDHPFDYAQFEGTIPEGNYGAGTVMVWDTGTWENLGPEPHEGLKKGKLHFRLSGKKLKGEWALVKMHGARATKGNEWLLLKHGEPMRAISARRDNTSALSGRTLAQIEKSPEREWKSKAH
ncbi:MAG: non-homologous end-joining DNA ligase [Candidatus Methylacidiphilales bacterium]|nr:non-homologous end-joining DNA ligase [Candidatus Methylacidiphilales bacterium]